MKAGQVQPFRRPIEKCARGEATLAVSSVTLDELQDAPPGVRTVVEGYDSQLEVVDATNEIANLADRYIESGALSQRMRSDARHIAAATVAPKESVE